ncbi:FxsA family protein [Pseudomonadales bacterium]|nr:FxsA family protein [Pseudomonadales bacterium]
MRFLLLFFIGIPILEMIVLIKVGGMIGAIPTVGLVVLTATIGYSVTKAEQDSWTRSLNAPGWAAPHWPVEVGGTDWSMIRRHIFENEMRSAHAPELQGFGFNMVGPAIIKYGTEAQKAHYLPLILNAEISWCQGYSEPQAGSDLASVRTRAESDGDDYVVTGSKIWTSAAEQADHIFVLVRTDPNAKPQLGISFLLIDSHAGNPHCRDPHQRASPTRHRDLALGHR